MNGHALPEVLERLVELGVLDAERASLLLARSPAPWWLAALQAVAAWVASLLIISSFFAPLYLFFEGPAGRGAAGIALLAAAVWLFGRAGTFAGQMGLAFSLAGQALVIFAIAGVYTDPWLHRDSLSTAGLLVAAGMMMPPSTPLHRTVCALMIGSHLGVLIGPGNGLAVYAIALAALAVAAWLGRARWAGSRYAPLVKALLHAATLGALVCAWLVSAEAARNALQSMADSGEPPTWWPTLYPAGTSLVLLGTVGWLTRAAAASIRAVALLAAGLLLAAAWNAPGLIACAAILLAVYQAGHRAWAGLALLAALAYLGEYYYSLHISLLAKSATLAATGLVLLALREAVQRWAGRPA